ncbi:MAG: tetratricopeptide repeat protein [Bacteroidetes bacterium]|nr:tetratricopeptide repeat protein [Bacteroidota bacterium]
MEKSKTQGKGAAKSTVVEAFHFTPSRRAVLAGLFPILAVIAGLLYAVPMPGTVGETGFPFDDAYTALTFARNLLEHGAYSFHAGVPATSGVTAPLQVFLLAAIGIFAQGVRASFAIGIVSFAVVTGLTFLLGLRLFRDREWIAAVAALLVALSPHMASAAVSGLPTLPFTALVLASAYFYFARRSMLFFLFAGLALWTHPAALVFFLAAIVHLLYSHLAVKQENKPSFEGERPVTGRATAIGGILYLLLVAGYGIFNYVLSGSFFVNPVGAKLTYYANATTAFAREVWGFYSHSWEAALVLFAIFALMMITVDIVRRRHVPLLMSAAFVVGMIAAYGLIFPIILDNHVLLPTLPFFTLLGVWGLWRAFALMAEALPLPFIRTLSRTVVTIIAGAAVVIALSDWMAYRDAHFRSVRLVLDRQVAAGRWIAENTFEDARIATHLPGAVSYYGRRPVFDITGKLTPSVIDHMGNLEELVAEFRSNRVTHIAARRDEFEVVNANPLFTSDPSQPGVMEVFLYTSGQTHLMSQAASALNVEAARLMGQKRWRDAEAVLQRSFKEDPYSCRTSTLYGLTILQLGDTANARVYLEQAVSLHDQYAPAMVPLADILVKQHRVDDGIRLLERALEINPESFQARSSLRSAMQIKRTDSLEAKGVHSYTFTR